MQRSVTLATLIVISVLLLSSTLLAILEVCCDFLPGLTQVYSFEHIKFAVCKFIIFVVNANCAHFSISYHK